MQSSPDSPKQPRPKNEADKSSLSVNEFNRELLYRNTVLDSSKTKWAPTPSTPPQTTCLCLLSSENVWVIRGSGASASLEVDNIEGDSPWRQN